MNRYAVLPAAYLIDQMAGDPEWFPHPVRLIGFTISYGESKLNRPGQSNKLALVSGAALTVAVAGSAYWLTAGILRLARMRSDYFGDAIEVLLAWTCLAARNLEQEAAAVIDAIESGSIPYRWSRHGEPRCGRDKQGRHRNRRGECLRRHHRTTLLSDAWWSSPCDGLQGRQHTRLHDWPRR